MKIMNIITLELSQNFVFLKVVLLVMMFMSLVKVLINFVSMFVTLERMLFLALSLIQHICTVILHLDLVRLGSLLISKRFDADKTHKDV